MYHPRVYLIKLALPQRTTSASPNASRAKRYLACSLCDMVVGDCGCTNVVGNLDNRWLVQGGRRSTPASYDQPEVPIRTAETKVQRYEPAEWCTTANGLDVC